MFVKHYGIALLCACCAACAPIGGNSRLEQRVNEQDMQLRQMQPQQADTWNEVQAMRQEINQLKGQLAQLNNAGGVRQDNAALQAGVASPALVQGADGTASVAQPTVQTQLVQREPVTGIMINQGNAPESSAYGNIVAKSQQAAQEQQPEVGSYGLPPEPQQVAAAAPTEATWGQADPQPAAQEPEPQKDLATALFEAGVNDFNARNYQASERSFKDFLKNYPQNKDVARAQYYLGECLFARNQYPQAALEYDVVIKKYPKSASAPGAYLKQGICFSKMKQPEAAKMQMQAVISKYPASPEAARAKTFLKTNK